ncbi:hypothetical protein M5689_022860 [Euphorbia peplus]|nr:hypothetical protein M5689_022860 [Euphorbia peplus]
MVLEKATDTQMRIPKEELDEVLGGETSGSGNVDSSVTEMAMEEPNLGPYGHHLKPDLSYLDPKPSFIEHGRLQNQLYHGLSFGSQIPLRFHLQTHVSSNVSAIKLKIVGNLTQPISWYNALPPIVQERIQATGFGPLISMLSPRGVRTDRAALAPLVERWMDSTHSFHFLHGEMTITPLDFSAITGLPFQGEHISFDSKLVCPALAKDSIDLLLGFSPSYSGKLQTRALEGYWIGRIATGTLLTSLEIEQCARCYIWFLLSCTLFPSSSSNCYWQILPVLTDLDKLPRLNWGAAGLAHLYHGLDSCCRGTLGKGQVKLKGFGLVLLIWAYEYGLLKRPKMYPLNSGFPRIGAWVQSLGLQVSGGERIGPVSPSLTIRPFDQLTKSPWIPRDYWLDSMVHAAPLSDRRILLEGPLSRVWYLGERVRGWDLGPVDRPVPPPPPQSMFWASGIQSDSKEMVALDGGVVYDSVGNDYTSFLLQLLPPTHGVMETRGSKKRPAASSSFTGTFTQVLPDSTPSSTTSRPTGGSCTPCHSGGPSPVSFVAPGTASGFAPASFMPSGTGGSSNLSPDVVLGSIEGLDRHLTYRNLDNVYVSTTLPLLPIEPIYDPKNTSHVMRAQSDEMFQLYHALKTFWIEDHNQMLMDVRRIDAVRADLSSQLGRMTQERDNLQAEVHRLTAQLDDPEDDDEEAGEGSNGREGFGEAEH